MNEFINVESVFKTLGDFWYSHYDNKDQIRALVYALVEVQKQIVEDTAFLENSISRHTIEPFRKVLWFPLHVLESDLIKNSRRYATYGDDTKYDGTALYGNITHTVYTVEIPEEIVRIESLYDKIVEPEFSVNNIVIKDHKIELEVNPFNLSSVYIESIYNESGEIVDREAVLWLSNISIDKEDLYNLFGYVLGIKLSSSVRYKQLINALFNALINGPSKVALSECMSAITGIPVVKEDNERVISVIDNTVHTNKNTYIFSDNDAITVTEGTLLQRGDTLSKGLTVATSTEEIKGLQLTPELTHLGYIGNLYVSNVDELLTISEASGKTVVNFPIHGSNKDVELFNSVVLSQGISDCVEITDACELANIKKILQLPNTSKDVEIQNNDVLNSGLTTWIRTRRLN